MKISPYLAFSASFALVASFAVPALAQTPSSSGGPSNDQPAATLKVQANEVLLPVTVRDKHGNLVTNLTAADFALTEDNKPQVIKSFSIQSDLPFLCGLLVDTSRSVSSAMDNERAAAGKFVDLMLPADPKNAKEGDQAFLLHFDREVELLEDFTNSRDKLHRELTEMGPTAAEHNNPSGPETTGDDNGGGQRGGGASHGGTQLYDAVYLASDELMKPKQGRKALVVFSDGVDRGSKETLNEAIDAADHANVSVYTIFFKGEQERSNNGFPGGRRGGMGGGWPGGGGGYPGGGYPGGGGQRPSRQEQVDGKKIMEDLATRTGARWFEAKKKENLDDIYNQIAQELRGQYLLSFTPDQMESDGAYHKISLKAKKDDYIVLTRDGFYAPGGNSN
ncbi:MAG: VWA domain-containing protein [Terracidiphilus sp.]